jgi:hypothetical protein
MIQLLKAIFTISFIFSFANGAELEVVTYNTGLARAMGKDFVPCVKPRMDAFLNNVLKKADVPTVFLFQEVFYTEAYKNLQRWAYENGFHVTESNSQRNGLVIVSELPIQTEFLQRYSCGRFMQNPGVLTARIGNDQQHMIDILNSHTSDSSGDKPDVCQMTQLHELSGYFNKRSGTVLAGGDFNVGPDLKILNQKYDPIRAIWEPFKNLMAGALRAPTEKLGVTWDI